MSKTTKGDEPAAPLRLQVSADNLEGAKRLDPPRQNRSTPEVKPRILVASSVVPSAGQLLTDALMVAGHELEALRCEAGRGAGLDDESSKRYSRVVKALQVLGAEEERRAKLEELDRLSDEELAELAKEALKTLTESGEGGTT